MHENPDVVCMVICAAVAGRFLFAQFPFLPRLLAPLNPLISFYFSFPFARYRIAPSCFMMVLMIFLVIYPSISLESAATCLLATQEGLLQTCFERVRVGAQSHSVLCNLRGHREKPKLLALCALQRATVHPAGHHTHVRKAETPPLLWMATLYLAKWSTTVCFSNLPKQRVAVFLRVAAFFLTLYTTLCKAMDCPLKAMSTTWC